MQEIRKSSYFKTLAPKDFQVPFLCNIGPLRKPSSRKDFPCMAYKFCRRYIYNPIIFPGEDNGFIYIAMEKFETQYSATSVSKSFLFHDINVF